MGFRLFDGALVEQKEHVDGGRRSRRDLLHPSDTGLRGANFAQIGVPARWPVHVRGLLRPQNRSPSAASRTRNTSTADSPSVNGVRRLATQSRKWASSSRRGWGSPS